MAGENPAPETPRNSPEPNAKKVEALTVLYRQYSEIYIHFTTWRDRLFAGYIALQGLLENGHAVRMDGSTPKEWS